MERGAGWAPRQSTDSIAAARTRNMVTPVGGFYSSPRRGVPSGSKTYPTLRTVWTHRGTWASFSMARRMRTMKLSTVRVVG